MTTPRWEKERRSDGLAIVNGIDGWVIMPRAEGLPIDRCPCCDKPFGTVRAAQLVADILFPMTREPSDAH